MGILREIALRKYDELVEAYEERLREERREDAAWVLKTLKEMFPEVPPEEFKPNWEEGTVEVDGLTFRCSRREIGRQLQMLIVCPKCGRERWADIERIETIGKLLHRDERLCPKCMWGEEEASQELPRDPLERMAFYLREIAESLEYAVQEEFFHP